MTEETPNFLMAYRILESFRLEKTFKIKSIPLAFIFVGHL